MSVFFWFLSDIFWVLPQFFGITPLCTQADSATFVLNGFCFVNRWMYTFYFSLQIMSSTLNIFVCMWYIIIGKSKWLGSAQSRPDGAVFIWKSHGHKSGMCMRRFPGACSIWGPQRVFCGVYKQYSFTSRFCKLKGSYLVFFLKQSSLKTSWG